jgi:DNA-binding response OmpR family regulator
MVRRANLYGRQAVGHILAVDDERDILVLYQEALGTFGHKVVGAVSGAEAMDYLERETPDLIILDLRMPGVSGLELLEWLRRRGQRVPVIVCSALSGLRDEFALSGSDIAAFVAKPPDMARLIHVVAEVLEGAPDAEGSTA